MKIKKRTALIVSLALGTVMFTTTAFAEVKSKSGYAQLKDSIKYTEEQVDAKLSNYTGEMSFVIKDNGNVVSSQSTVIKVDKPNETMESTFRYLKGQTDFEKYSYSDKKNGHVIKTNSQDVYWIVDYAKPSNKNIISNPFTEKRFDDDIEKIADALIGNLKDAVVVNENSDGGKTLSASISEAQIPTLINAVVSFQTKNIFSSNQDYKWDKISQIKKDIYVKEAKGNMVVDKRGIIQNILGTGVISAKEDNGTEHDFTFELLVKISNVNTTKVIKPDLSGKKVENHSEEWNSTLSNLENYIGKYKANMVIEKDGKFEKIGEQIIDITAIDDKTISGTYHEEYAKGYESYGTDKKDFKFQGNLADHDHNLKYTITSSSNSTITGNMFMIIGTPDITFELRQDSKPYIKYNDFNKIFN